jgi:hypothetical protein
MPDPIAFPDAEAAIIPHLRDQLVALGMPVPVSGKVPNPVPARHVRVVRTGGLRSNLVMDRARLTFECRDSSIWAAHGSTSPPKSGVRPHRRIQIPGHPGIC